MFDRAIAEFSTAYADQNERDYAAFTEAVNSGRLIAQPACRPLRPCGPGNAEPAVGTPQQPCLPMP